MKIYDSNRKQIIRLLLAAFILVIMLSLPAFSYEIDSTKVREKPEEKTSFGEALLAVPSFILNSPFWLLENTADFTINEIFYSEFIQSLFFLDIDRLWGFYPIGGYGSNSGVKAGIAFSTDDLFSDNEDFKLKASYSTHEYQTYSMKYHIRPENRIFHEIYFEFSYRKKPRESLYGLGNGTVDDNEVGINMERGYLGMGWDHEIAKNLLAGFNLSYQTMNLYDGQDPDLIGSLDSIQYKFDLSDDDLENSRLLTFGLNITHDWRDHPGQTTSGGYNSIEFSYNKGRGRLNDLEYYLASVNLYQFLHIFRQRVLVFNLRMETLDETNSSPGLPFYLKPSLGGEESLHGYQSNRFIDNSYIFAAVEYRFPVLRNVDGFVFVEEGRVFHEITEDLTLRNWHYSAGIGARLWDQEGLRFSSYMAFSKEGVQFYVQLSEEL